MKKIFTFLVLICSIYQASGQVSLVKDCYPGDTGSYPRKFVIYKDSLFFFGSIPGKKSAIFKTNGTTAGTQIAMEYAGNFDHPRVLNNQIIFFDAANKGIYATDGTTAGTQKLMTANDVRPDGFVEYNGKLYVAAKVSSSRYETYETDGTPAGTKLFYFPPIGAYDDVRKIAKAGGLLYVHTNTYINGDNQLWATDGTYAGSVMVANINAIDYFLDMAEYKNKMFFPVGSTQLWSSDGTLAGTTAVKSSMNAKKIRRLFVHNNELFFMADDMSINDKVDLWKTDGTDAGTIKITDSLAPSESLYYYPTSTRFASRNGKLYFAGEKRGGSVEGKDKGLYVTDGTRAGTQVVRLIPKMEKEPFFVVADTNVYFKANDIAGIQLWKSNGTTGGTKALYALTAVGTYKSPLPYYSDNIITYHDTVFYAAQYDSTGLGLELYKYTNNDTPVKTAVPIITSNNVDAKLYPNPVNETAMLDIALGQAARVNVAIYNTAGIKMKDVCNKELSAGKHSIPVLTEDVPEGLYYISIDTGIERPTIIKMVK